MTEEKRKKIIEVMLGVEEFVSFRDLYKLLYQSFHGAGHFVMDENEAGGWFRKEWEDVSSKKGYGPELYTSLSIPGVTPELYRVHFGGLVENEIDPGKLLAEFLRTAREYPSHWPTKADNLHEKFIEIWEILGEEIESGMLENLNLVDYREFTGLVESKNWPMVSHSEEYRKKFNPHYRVVMDLSRVLPVELL